MNENQQVVQTEQNPDMQVGNHPAEVKMIPQPDVNQIVGHARQKGEKVGYEKGYSDALSSLQSNQKPQSAIDEASARKIAQETFAQQLEALNKKAQEEAAKQQGIQILNELGTKISSDKQNIPDFDNVVKLENFTNVPGVLHLANMVDNSGHVLYELQKNPMKLAAVTSLLSNGMTGNAMQAIKDISDSAKQNQLALQQPKSPEPLNQIKPSNIGLGNGSKQSVADLRKDPSYRG